MICFWCKAEWIGDHVCQETFEILGERKMPRNPEAVEYVTARVRKKRDEV